MAYLTGELAELKKRPLTTGISFIVMYFNIDHHSTLRQ